MQSNLDSKAIASSIISDLIKSIQEPDPFEKKKHNENYFINMIEKSSIIRSLQFKQNGSQKEYILYHIPVYQQHLFNFCGYHASYNLLTIVNGLKNKVPIILDKPQNFWKYVFKTQNFLWDYGKSIGLSSEWPWNFHSTHFGDFERTFLKVCSQSYPYFFDTFRSEKNFDIKFLNLNSQFYNLLIEEWELNAMEKEINDFVKFSKSNHHKVLAFMLGICNHWVSFLAHKYNNHVELFFLDSRNIDYLTFSEQQIIEHVEEMAQQRIKEGKVPYTNFKIMINQQSIRDIQRIISLLCNCVIGNTTLWKYYNDRRFIIIYTSFQEEIPAVNSDFNNMNYENLFNSNNKSLEGIFGALNQWVRRNKSSLEKFFFNFHDKNDLDEEYNIKLNKFLNYFRHMFKFLKNERSMGINFTSKFPYLPIPLKISPLFDHSNL